MMAVWDPGDDGGPETTEDDNMGEILADLAPVVIGVVLLYLVQRARPQTFARHFQKFADKKLKADK